MYLINSHDINLIVDAPLQTLRLFLFVCFFKPRFHNMFMFLVQLLEMCMQQCPIIISMEPEVMKHNILFPEVRTDSEI